MSRLGMQIGMTKAVEFIPGRNYVKGIIKYQVSLSEYHYIP